MDDFVSSLSGSERKSITRQRIQEDMVARLATLAYDYLSHPGWLYERKFVGERIFAVKSEKTFDLSTRNGLRVSNTYPEIASALAKTRKATSYIIDGEVVAFDGLRTRSSEIQKRMHIRDAEGAKSSLIPVLYYVFDIMYRDGYDIEALSLYSRKRILKESFLWLDPLRYTSHVLRNGEAYYAEGCSKGWEGIIAKKFCSPYELKRSGHWLKFKCRLQQAFIIVGFTRPHGERTHFGALLLAYYGEGRLCYAGRVGRGFNAWERASLATHLGKLRISECPLSEEVSSKERTWVEPVLVSEIGFSQWTRKGRLRHPACLGLRRDKEAGDVTGDIPDVG